MAIFNPEAGGAGSRFFHAPAVSPIVYDDDNDPGTASFGGVQVSSSAAAINPATMQDPGAGYEGVPPEQYMQEYNHEWDEKAAQAQMDFQTAANKEAMDYSERMVDKQAALLREFRRTAYQDAVYDLKEAGLNPILAYTQGGAALPSISSPQGITSAGAYARNSDTGYTYYEHQLDQKRLNYAYTQMVVNAASSVLSSFLGTAVKLAGV